MKNREIVCPRKTRQPVFPYLSFAVLDPDMPRINLHHLPVFTGDHKPSGVNGNGLFNTGCDKRRMGLNARDRLFLHVGTHERAVRIVMLKKRNERGRRGEWLVCGDVNKINLSFRDKPNLPRFILRAHLHRVLEDDAVRVVIRRCGVRNVVLFFLKRVQIDHFVGNLPVLHARIRRFNNPEVVHERVER